MAFETEKLAVANGALLRLGAKKISDINELSDRATLCRQWIDQVRQEALREHPWNFALFRTRLSTFPQATLTPGAISGTGVTFIASASVFGDDDASYKLMADGSARITTVVSPTQVVADIEGNFASTSAIAASSWRIAPAWGYNFRYAKPTGYLRVFEVSGVGGTIWSWWNRDNSVEPVKVEGQFLVSDVGGRIDIRYTRDIENPTLWDANATNAIESLLAFRICGGVTGGLQRAKTMWDAYQAALSSARTVDGQEGTGDSLFSDILIDVRR